MTNILCLLGFHKWEPTSNERRSEYISKYEMYEYADGECSRCHIESEIRKEVWW